MSRRMTLRLVVTFALGAGAFVISTGCGGSKPSSAASKEKTGDDGTKGHSTSASTQPPRKVELDSSPGKDAVAFLKALGESAAKADQLSVVFVRATGLPAELPGDKTKGFSAAAAESWMKRVGGGAIFGLPAGFAGSDAAVLWGGFQGHGRKGDYYLRMVNESGAWKVDYFALSSVPSAPEGSPPQGPDAEYQRFAARAVAGLLCDRDAMPTNERAMAIAAGLTPALRARLADPFGSDKEQGFDFNRGKLNLEAEKIGGGAESYSITQLSPATDFRLEVMKAGGAKSTYLLKLVKGSTPGQWPIDSIAQQ